MTDPSMGSLPNSPTTSTNSSAPDFGKYVPAAEPSTLMEHVDNKSLKAVADYQSLVIPEINTIANYLGFLDRDTSSIYKDMMKSPWSAARAIAFCLQSNDCAKVLFSLIIPKCVEKSLHGLAALKSSGKTMVPFAVMGGDAHNSVCKYYWVHIKSNSKQLLCLWCMVREHFKNDFKDIHCGCTNSERLDHKVRLSLSQAITLHVLNLLHCMVHPTMPQVLAPVILRLLLLLKFDVGQVDGALRVFLLEYAPTFNLHISQHDVTALWTSVADKLDEMDSQPELLGSQIYARICEANDKLSKIWGGFETLATSKADLSPLQMHDLYSKIGPAVLKWKSMLKSGAGASWGDSEHDQHIKEFEDADRELSVLFETMEGHRVAAEAFERAAEAAHLASAGGAAGAAVGSPKAAVGSPKAAAATPAAGGRGRGRRH
jgi:hypothetical protein